MRIIDEEVVIHRTPQEVWDYAADLRHHADWERSIVSEQPVDGDWATREGMELDYVIKAGAMKMHAHSRIIDLDAGHIATYELTSPVGTVQGSYIVEPHPEGATFRHHVESRRSGMVKDALSTVTMPLFRRQIRAGVEALRDQLEKN